MKHIGRTHMIAMAVGIAIAVALRVDAQADARRFSMRSIREGCIPLTALKEGSGDEHRECSVYEAGTVGEVDALQYHYVIYCLSTERERAEGRWCVGHALVVFARDAGKDDLHVAFERVSADGGYGYSKPEIVQTTAGTILDLPIAVDGTGNFNASEYYARDHGRWDRIEAEAWLKDLDTRLPKGLAIWKGVWPDFHRMEAEAGLYKKGDANCCATGGFALAKLALRGKKLVLKSVTFAEKPSIPTEVLSRNFLNLYRDAKRQRRMSAMIHATSLTLTVSDDENHVITSYLVDREVKDIVSHTSNPCGTDLIVESSPALGARAAAQPERVVVSACLVPASADVKEHIRVTEKKP